MLFVVDVQATCIYNDVLVAGGGGITHNTQYNHFSFLFNFVSQNFFFMYLKQMVEKYL